MNVNQPNSAHYLCFLH